MKKILLALMVLACAATSSFAADGVAINWTTLWGGYTHNAPNVTDDPSSYFLLDSYNITWQLIYSVNSSADPIDLSNGANGWVSLTGDDTVWATRTLAQSVGGANVTASDSTVWNNGLYFQSGDVQFVNTNWVTAGYVYQRVYEGAPAVGSWFFETTPEVLVINPVNFQESFADLAGGGTAGFKPNEQISAVPEPATMGLLGLGALVMAIRRRRS